VVGGRTVVQCVYVYVCVQNERKEKEQLKAQRARQHTTRTFAINFLYGLFVCLFTPTHPQTYTRVPPRQSVSLVHPLVLVELRRHLSQVRHDALHHACHCMNREKRTKMAHKTPKASHPPSIDATRLDLPFSAAATISASFFS
jgi:hypothetical protein